MSKPFATETLLIKVIDDLADFLPYLVLVGGWVPYIYAKYIWKNIPNLAVSTADIDFGIGNKEFKGKDSVASYVRKLGYGERHISMDRLTPFVPVVKDSSGTLKAEVEFIVDPKVSKGIREQVIGSEIKINEIENFGILLEDLVVAAVKGHEVRLPSESLFVFHKMLTFVQRENKEKFKKDLYYAYYMLRFSPKKEILTSQVRSLIKDKKQGRRVIFNLRKYFSSIDSPGPVLVEQENGPDAYIHDLRKDIFERFGKLISMKD